MEDLTDQVECTAEVIGRGGFGIVYKGRWVVEAANVVPIAVKVIKVVVPIDEADEEQQMKRSQRELELWSKISHKNVLPLLGIAYLDYENSNIPAFICPWMENGNAKQFRMRNPSFPPILILYDIIQGLHYLHTSDPEIVHGDIKAVNVLINNRYEACLCDFGLSRILSDSTLWITTTRQAGGSIRWMSPELVTGEECFPTKESDIYAYGMTCYEILSGDVPFKSVNHEATLVYKVTSGKRPERIESCHYGHMWDIITRCWKQKPEDRLRTAEVLESIQRMDMNSDSPLHPLLEARAFSMLLVEDINKQKAEQQEEIRGLREKISKITEDTNQQKAKVERLEANITNICEQIGRENMEIQRLQAKVTNMVEDMGKQRLNHENEIKQLESRYEKEIQRLEESLVKYSGVSKEPDRRISEPSTGEKRRDVEEKIGRDRSSEGKAQMPSPSLPPFIFPGDGTRSVSGNPGTRSPGHDDIPAESKTTSGSASSGGWSIGERIEAKALFDFTRSTEQQLGFVKGEVLEIINRSGKNWWMVKNKYGKTGMVPSNYLRVMRP